jgi:hypothetical protein
MRCFTTHRHPNAVRGVSNLGRLQIALVLFQACKASNMIKLSTIDGCCLHRGDRVLVAFDIACGKCFFCDHGYHSSCDKTNPSKVCVHCVGSLLLMTEGDCSASSLAYTIPPLQHVACLHLEMCCCAIKIYARLGVSRVTCTCRLAMLLHNPVGCCCCCCWLM